MREKTINIFDYLRLIIKWRKLFMLCFSASVGLSVIISIFLPKEYRAEATLISQEWGLQQPVIWNSELIAFDLIYPRQIYSNYYLGILNSRTVAEAIARKYDLLSIYKSNNIEDAIEFLRQRSEIRIDDEGIIHIWVTDYSSQRSADIANEFVNQLERTVINFEIEKAKTNRIFIAERLNEVSDSLRETEKSLQDFQSKYGLVSLPSQVEVTISNWAELRAKITALEVKKRILESYQSGIHPELLLVKRELTELKRSLNALQTNSGIEQKQFFVSLSDIPKLELEYARLKRQLLIQENLYQLLAQEYEKAKIEEARNTPLLIVLDRALPPEEKYKPNRIILIFSSALTGCLVAGVIMIVSEYRGNLRKLPQALNHSKNSPI